MLQYYGIAAIPGARGLQRQIPNLTTNNPPSLYALSNYYIGTDLAKKEPDSIRCDNWSKYRLGFDHIKYAALDARLGFEIARRHGQLVSHNSIRDRLNV